MAHSKEDRLYTTGLGRIVQLGVALGYVADTDEGGVSERLLESFFKAVEPGNAAEREFLFAGELIAGGEVGEELGGVPAERFIFNGGGILIGFGK